MAHTPEEEVRQSFISYWTLQKGFPRGLISVEVSLASIASFSAKVPKRRLDLVFFSNSAQGLQPLMLVECKADKIDDAAERQLIGYNQFVLAPFLCLASNQTKRYAQFIQGEWEFSDKEPHLLQ